MKRKKAEGISKIIDQKVDEINSLLSKETISSNLETNVTAISKLFENDDTLVMRNFVNIKKGTNFFIIYTNGMVDTKVINDNILRPLMLTEEISDDNIIDTLINKILQTDEIKRVRTLKEIIENVTYGDTALFIENCNIEIGRAHV